MAVKLEKTNVLKLMKNFGKVSLSGAEAGQAN